MRHYLSNRYRRTLMTLRVTTNYENVFANAGIHSLFNMMHTELRILASCNIRHLGNRHFLIKAGDAEKSFFRQDLQN